MWVFNTRHDFGVETDPTQGEFFVNNEIDRSSALVRETIQNSLDARRDDVSTVEVRFAFHEGALFLGPTMLREYLSDLIPHLRLCGLDLDGIDLNEPRFLVVEDFGTHGLRGNPATKEPSDFYYFWHVVGRSGKGDAKAGRWGLGKTVFPNSSQISAFFGYTVRSDDRRQLLLGQTCLKTHSLNGTTYLPYAFYQSSGERTFELPYEEVNRHTDLGGKNALISRHFYYFGSKARSLPKHLLGICHQTQGHRSDSNAVFVQPFIDWIESLKLIDGQLYGWPDFIINWGDAQNCGCRARKEDGENDKGC